MLSRRHLLTTAAGGAALGLVNLSFLRKLPPVTAAEQQVDPARVRLDDSIEPLVRLLETTPRDRTIEEVAERVKHGLSYRELLAALLLAGVRNVEPRPSVGFQFHAVLVVNSAHLASVSGPAEDRWLPLFWAVDNFKAAQRRDEANNAWTMAPVDESALPPAHKARQVFIEAMDAWDAEKADAAVAALARSATPQQVFELFFSYGARDLRSIGHKAIFVANSYRALQVIGEHHAEPVFRSLAYALLNHVGDSNPAQSDHAVDRPWRIHQELADRFPDRWQAGMPDRAATADLTTVLRGGDPEAVGEQVLTALQNGIAPASLWDGLFSASAELMLRQSNIVALHAVTTTNAMYQCYRWTADERTRRLLLLQNSAFVPMFLASMKRRGSVPDRSLADLARLDDSDGDGDGDRPGVEEIFDTLSRDRVQAARRTHAYLANGGSARDLMNTARRLIFVKGNNAHDYKFSSAVLEDYHHVSAPWRNLYLAANVGRLRGTGDRDNPLIERTREALA